MDYYSVPRRILRGARQLVYPRRCPFCDRVLGSVPVCPDCAAELEKLRRKPGMRLDASQHYLGELTGAAAPFRYEGCVRRGILHTKYHAAPWAAVELGLWLAKLAFGSEMHMAGAEPVPELVEGMSLGYDCIVPVPASGRARGYNVPQLMAVPLARALGIPLYPKALGRTRAKRHQAGLPFEQRLANVAGAFRVTDTDESPAAPLSRHITRASSKRITEKTLRVTCYERESERVITTTGQPASNRVLEFLPAPGQFVNETGMAGYTGQKSFEEARLYAENRLKKGEFVSLGNFGGYVILAFDHSVENKGKYDFSIPGNQFEGSNEPGVVWVMQDVNGNGKPDDEWYELRGSETGGEWTVQEYAVTYYRPAGPRQGVKWTDNLGRSGQVAYLGQFHAQDYYYPLWLEEESHTYYGTGLRQNTTQTPGGDWSNNSFEWGYVDNAGSDNLESSSKTGKTWFKISNAMTPDGQPAGLRYIDFIKVQSAINGSAGGLGELSTEVAGMAVDENLNR